MGYRVCAFVVQYVDKGQNMKIMQYKEVLESMIQTLKWSESEIYATCSIK